MHLALPRLSAGVLAAAALAWASPELLARGTRAHANGAQEAPEGGALFVRAAKVIVRPGEVLADAGIIVQDGVIVAVGAGLERPAGAREIAGEVVCAGFLDPWSTLGLDRGALRDERTSPASPTADALDLYGDDHLRLDAARAGVTSARLQAGEKSSVGGLGVVVRNAPDLERERALVVEDAGVAASVGLSVGQSRGRGPSVKDVFDRVKDVEKLGDLIEAGRKYHEDWVEYGYEIAEWEKAIAEKEAELEKDFKKAQKAREKEVEDAKEKGKEHKEKKYKEDKRPKKPKLDEDKEVMARVARGELPLLVEVHRAAEIRHLLELTAHFDQLRLVLCGATEALPLAEELAERDVAVIVWPSPLGTDRADHLRKHDLALAGRLAAAGVGVLLGSGGESAATRDLPLLAGLAIGHGLDREAAFAALTEGAARALDVADRLGTLERGKDADLLVLDGEPLVSTTRVRYAVVAGEVVVTPDN